MNKCDAIETQISQVLDSVIMECQKCGGFSDPEWTRKVKEGLCRLGQENKYGVSAAGCDGSDEGEWLYDLIWCDGQDEPWVFWEMTLAMECEWNLDRGQIIYDFEKLLVGKARHKLLVFQQKNSQFVKEVMDSLKKIVQQFKVVLPGERYLLAGYSVTDRKFSYELVTV